MLPNYKQWKKWSLPSKYSAIGLLLAILGFVPFSSIFNSNAASKSIDKTEPKTTFKAPIYEIKFPEIKIKTAREAFNEYDGDGYIKYAHLNLTDYPSLAKQLSAVNSNRIEYPKRAIDLAVLRDLLNSGDIRLSTFAATEIIRKQTNLRKLKKPSNQIHSTPKNGAAD
jgi:hypothetical protein